VVPVTTVVVVVAGTPYATVLWRYTIVFSVVATSDA
jgi:hypothetical protein